MALELKILILAVACIVFFGRSLYAAAVPFQEETGDTIVSDIEDDGQWYLYNYGPRSVMVEYRVRNRRTDQCFEVIARVEPKKKMSLAPLVREEVAVHVLVSHEL